ncbi:MAG: hypothetical protein AAF153_01050, partial [Pseudomonadota bacterium]
SRITEYLKKITELETLVSELNLKSHHHDVVSIDEGHTPTEPSFESLLAHTLDDLDNLAGEPIISETQRTSEHRDQALRSDDSDDDMDEELDKLPLLEAQSKAEALKEELRLTREQSEAMALILDEERGFREIDTTELAYEANIEINRLSRQITNLEEQLKQHSENSERLLNSETKDLEKQINSLKSQLQAAVLKAKGAEAARDEAAEAANQKATAAEAETAALQKELETKESELEKLQQTHAQTLAINHQLQQNGVTSETLQRIIAPIAADLAAITTFQASTDKLQEQLSALLIAQQAEQEQHAAQLQALQEKLGALTAQLIENNGKAARGNEATTQALEQSEKRLHEQLTKMQAQHSQQMIDMEQKHTKQIEEMQDGLEKVIAFISTSMRENHNELKRLMSAHTTVFEGVYNKSQEANAKDEKGLAAAESESLSAAPSKLSAVRFKPGSLEPSEPKAVSSRNDSNPSHTQAPYNKFYELLSALTNEANKEGTNNDPEAKIENFLRGHEVTVSGAEFIVDENNPDEVIESTTFANLSLNNSVDPARLTGALPGGRGMEPPGTDDDISENSIDSAIQTAKTTIKPGAQQHELIKNTAEHIVKTHKNSEVSKDNLSSYYNNNTVNFKAIAKAKESMILNTPSGESMIFINGELTRYSVENLKTFNKSNIKITDKNKAVMLREVAGHLATEYNASKDKASFDINHRIQDLISGKFDGSSIHKDTAATIIDMFKQQLEAHYPEAAEKYSKTITGLHSMSSVDETASLSPGTSTHSLDSSSGSSMHL